MSYVFILGASDPEMSAVEKVCKITGHSIIYANDGGRRVHAGNAYNADSISLADYAGLTPVWIECRSDNFDSGHLVIDHHHEGDPGFGCSPDEYWRGSSIGQLCNLLGYERTNELSIVAAADHCLSHAYKGRCPGVVPSELRKWRASSRAAYQRVPVKKIEDDIALAISVLSRRPYMSVGGRNFIDGRGVKLKEFAEAAAILGESVIYSIYYKSINRTKIGVLGGSVDKISVWMEWAKTSLVDCYGDPERGYAGGYCEGVKI